MSRSAMLALALSLAGCAFFAALSGETQEQARLDAEAETRRLAEEAAAAQARADEQLAAELEPLRAAANAEGATLDAVLVFGDKVAVAIQSGAIQRGKIPAIVVDEARAALDKQAPAAADPGSVAEIESMRGLLFASEGRTDEAAGSYLAAILAQPALPTFNVLASLARTPTTDAAVLQTCPLIRPQIEDPGVPDFVALCLEAGAGDRTRLAWKSSKKDLQAYDVEMARRAEEARVAAEEARLAAEAEQLAIDQAAAAAAQLDMWATAAVFASGNCRFSNCMKDGWEVSTDAGTVVTSCRFSNCATDGWETRFPDGSTAVTSCRFSDCFKDGWETRFPDGNNATTTCRFSNCKTDGWQTQLPDGYSATTTCRFSDCFKDGWETALPNYTVTCNCKFENCMTEGIDCN